MRIEIHVVKTELNKRKSWVGEVASLEVIKSEIVHEFGGLTIIPNCLGYWEEPTKFYVDNTEIWLIYTNADDTRQIIEAFVKRIKKLTYQKSQAFTIDGTLYLV